jgi:short-subunit dehydrogenase
MNILCFGATSDLGRAVLRKLATPNNSFWLYARDKSQLTSLGLDLKNRGSKDVEVDCFDAEKKVLPNLPSLTIDLAIICQGYLPKDPLDSSELEKVFNVNFFSVVRISEYLLEKFKQQKFGTLVVFSSVAADRGRAKIGFYGAAKSALDSYLSARRQSLKDYPLIKIVTVKPGFVKTKMTAGIQGPLPSKPERVAEDVIVGLAKGKDVIYTPWFWRWIMAGIKLIPEGMFKRFNF